MGKLSGFKTKKITNCLEKKLSIDFRSGSERNGWYCLGNKQVLRITLPKEHGGKSLSIGVAKKIISSLRLKNAEFQRLYDCPMSGSDYKKIVEGFEKEGLL